jgi:hypothetical protein
MSTEKIGRSDAKAKPFSKAAGNLDLGSDPEEK